MTAAWWRRAAAQTGFETRAALRNGEQLLLTLVLPALALVVLGRTELVDLGSDGSAVADRLDLVAPGVIALAVVSSAFTSRAIALGFDRRSGVLRLLGTTPLGRSGLVAGTVGVVLVVVAGQVVLLGALAAGLGWRPETAGLPAAALAVLLGSAALGSLAVLLAGALRAEAVLAVANLVWVLLLVGGGVVLPAAALPGPLADLAPWQPAGALGEALRTCLVEGGTPVTALLTLAGWAVLLGLAARRWFRWQ